MIDCVGRVIGTLAKRRANSINLFLYLELWRSTAKTRFTIYTLTFHINAFGHSTHTHTLGHWHRAHIALHFAYLYTRSTRLVVMRLIYWFWLRILICCFFIFPPFGCFSCLRYSDGKWLTDRGQFDVCWTHAYESERFRVVRPLAFVSS